MIIRPAKEDDAETIGELWLELVYYHLNLDANMPVPASDGQYRYAQRIRYSITDPYTKTFVAEIDGKLVGYVFGTVIDILPDTFVDERAGMVGDIHVTEVHRGNGIGKALMQAMIDWFKLRGVKHYEWYVAAANERGRAFWQEAMHGTPVMIRMRAMIDADDDD